MTLDNAISGIKRYCMATESDIVGEAQYRFIDNNSSVLAVVHADTVAKDVHNFSVDNSVVTSIALDDRLGMWIIFDLLPEYGILPDVLITRDEEIGRSTAQFFETSKQYNWIFSFDRNRYDVVMYQYDNPDSASLLQDYGFRVGIGSFSDISYLTHLGCIGFNFGTGYINEHTVGCHADVSQVMLQVGLFAKFYQDNCDTLMAYDAKSIDYYECDDDLDFYSWNCRVCGDTLTAFNISEDSYDTCLLCEGYEHYCMKDDAFSDDYNYNRDTRTAIGDRVTLKENGELISGTVIDIIGEYMTVYWDDGQTTEEPN